MRIFPCSTSVSLEHFPLDPSKARIITEVRESHFDRQLFNYSMLVLGDLKYQLFFKSQAKNCLKGYFHIYKTLSCFPEFYHLDG